MPRLVLTVPLPPNQANGRMHWRVKNQKRKAYLAACDALQLTGKIPPPPLRAWDRARLTAVCYVGAEHDLDNLMARAKWSIDWLVSRGYIEDDKGKHLEWTGFPEQVVKRGQDYRIELTLEAA